jgi:hypothetical protein
MKRVTIALALTLGCAPNLSKATSYADKALAIVHVAAEQGAREYQQAVSVAVSICRAQLGEHSTPESRETCLGRLGFAPGQIKQIEAAYENLAMAYDAIAEALELVRQARPALEDAERAVQAVRQ